MKYIHSGDGITSLQQMLLLNVNHSSNQVMLFKTKCPPAIKMLHKFIMDKGNIYCTYPVRGVHVAASSTADEPWIIIGEIWELHSN
jgi:hypothetical protein